MARRIPGFENEGTATLEIKAGAEPGIWDVYVTPSDERIREGGLDPDEDQVSAVVMVTLDQNHSRVRLHPVYTRPNPDGSFSPKNKEIKSISFDWFEPVQSPDQDDVDWALEHQPDGMVRDPNYGLGLKKEYRFILDAVAEVAKKPCLYIGDGEPLPDEFKLPMEIHKELVAEIDRIDSRALTAENEVKATTAFNMIAAVVGLNARPFRLGRHKIRQLIQRFAADKDFTDPDVQEELIIEVARAASTFAQRNAAAAKELVSEIQLTRLELAVQQFEQLMARNHNESKWQEFFESDPFLLTFAFGYPISFVNGQSYVGGRRIDGKGEKCRFPNQE
jgi:hypothetical protein